MTPSTEAGQSLAVPAPSTITYLPSFMPASYGPEIFLLIHGAGLDGHSWDGVASWLRLAGHSVHAPTLYGHGELEPPFTVTHEDVMARLERYLDDHGLRQQYRRLNVVGWSLGGLWTQLLVARCFDCIKRAIFLDAFVLEPGESIMSLMAQQLGPEAVKGYEQFKDKEHNTFRFPWPMFQQMAPDAAMSPERQQHLYEEYASFPEPWDVSTEVPNPQAIADFLGAARLDPYLMTALALPASYITIAGDTSFDVERSDGNTLLFWPSMAARLGKYSLGITLHVGAHYAPLTEPQATAGAILQAVGVRDLPDFAALARQRRLLTAATAPVVAPAEPTQAVPTPSTPSVA